MYAPVRLFLLMREISVNLKILLGAVAAAITGTALLAAILPGPACDPWKGATPFLSQSDNFLHIKVCTR